MQFPTSFSPREAAVAGAGLLGLGISMLTADQVDTPPGPAGRTADTILETITGHEGLEFAGTENLGGEYMIEFHMEDRDPHFPSAVNIDTDTGRITEAVLRFGPLGSQSKVDNDLWFDLEGEWMDVVMNVAPSDLMDAIGNHGIDLGDRWVAEEVRPHIRLHDKPEGYDISPREFANFVADINDKFLDQYGHYTDRLYSEEWNDRFADYLQ